MAENTESMVVPKNDNANAPRQAPREKGFVIVSPMGWLEDWSTGLPCFYRHKRSAERVRRKHWSADMATTMPCVRISGEHTANGLPSYILGS